MAQIRTRTDFQSGFLSQSIGASATTLVSNQFQTLPAVASPNYVAISVDPLAANGNPEIMWITAHTASSASATVTRQAENSVLFPERSHSPGEAWVQAATLLDFDGHLPITTSGSLPSAGSSDEALTYYESDTGLIVFNTGSAWVTIADTNAWTSYTPTWTTTGTAPSLGNGTIAGQYLMMGKTLNFRILLTWGSTTTGGTNPWSFSIPASATSVAGVQMLSGVYQHSGNFFLAGVVAGAATTVQPVYLATTTYTSVTATAPVTWATGDVIELNGIIQVA